MKTIFHLITILQFLTIQLYAQEFQTSIFAESNGKLDSIFIGFDNSASIDIDNQFGEIDINNTIFDTTFEIRAGQIDLNNLNCGGANSTDPNYELITYMSKTDIVPRDCNGWDNTQTINGLAPISSIFIRNQDLPVILKWDSSVFDNECLEGSIITDWHPGGWFDASCDGVSVLPTELVNQDSIIINNPSGIFLTDSFGDTLSMFHIALGDKDFINNVTELIEEKIKIYPNPTNGFINIESEELQIKLVEVYNAMGQLVYKNLNTQNIDLEKFPNGIYFLKIDINGLIVTKKINKYCQ